jgi:RNA recognition motif-containing protein
MTHERDLYHLFSRCGKVHTAQLQYGHDKRPRGLAFVEYSEEGAAQRAVEELNGHPLDGRLLHVVWWKGEERNQQQQRPESREYVARASGREDSPLREERRDREMYRTMIEALQAKAVRRDL